MRSHHERPDGRGYPDGLFGDRIPLEARILSVADCYEAMTSDRAYSEALRPEEARAELRRCSGTQFDSAVVDAFLDWGNRAFQRAPAGSARAAGGDARQVELVGLEPTTSGLPAGALPTEL